MNNLEQALANDALYPLGVFFWYRHFHLPNLYHYILSHV